MKSLEQVLEMQKKYSKKLINKLNKNSKSILNNLESYKEEKGERERDKEKHNKIVCTDSIILTITLNDNGLSTPMIMN